MESKSTMNELGQNDTPEKKVCKKYTIGVDTLTKNVIQWDEDGAILIFESDIGKFKELPEDVVRGLNARNKSSYFEAQKTNKVELEQRDLKPTEGVHVNTKFAAADQRLEVSYPPGWRDKWHPCWKRPDELQTVLAIGYSYVGTTGEDKGVMSFGRDVERGKHVVGAFGREELYLMKISNDGYNALRKRDEDQSRRNNGMVEEAAVEELKSLGGNPTNNGSTPEILKEGK